MSSKTQQYLTSSNLDMLTRVLDTAGIYDISAPWYEGRRMRFGCMLIKLFQMGVTSEAALVDAIVNQIRVLHPSCIPTEVDHYSRMMEMRLARTAANSNEPVAGS